MMNAKSQCEEIMIKIKFHSIVDVITNSSTTIFTYQNSTKEAKELVAEVLKLSEIDKKPEDIFYYGVFCDVDTYIDDIGDEDDVDLSAGFPSEWEEQKEWMEDFFVKIMKGEVEQPEWMSNAETDDDRWDPDSYLYLIPKDEKYKDLGEKIKRLLSSVDADGGHVG